MTLAGGARWTGREGLASTQELWRKGVFSWRKKRVGSQRPRWSLWLFMNVGLMAWPLFWSGTWRSTCFSKCCYWKWDAEGPVLLTIKWSSHWRNPIFPWGKTGHKGQAIFTGSCRWVGGGSRILVGQPREPAHGWEDAQMTHLCLWLSVVRASANCKLLQATTGIPRIEGQGTASQTSWKACSGPEVTSATEATALLQRRPPRGVTPSLYTPEPGGMQTSPRRVHQDSGSPSAAEGRDSFWTNPDKWFSFPFFCSLFRKDIVFSQETKFQHPLFFVLLICGVGEDSWESLGLQGDPTRPS